jgi:hypothetical protein
MPTVPQMMTKKTPCIVLIFGQHKDTHAVRADGFRPSVFLPNDREKCGTGREQNRQIGQDETVV